jgi:hypothetical protein
MATTTRSTEDSGAAVRLLYRYQKALTIPTVPMRTVVPQSNTELLPKRLQAYQE